MPSASRKSIERSMLKQGLSGPLVVLLAGAIAIGTSGCFLPALSVIPSVIGLAFNLSNKKSDADSEVAAKAQEADATTAQAPPVKLTSEDECHLMAIARPDVLVVELRKDTIGAPQYRELHMVNSADAARWTPVVDSETGPNGWRPAVNFLKMDFNPPLKDMIPDTGSCYLAYAPTAIDANALDPAALKSGFEDGSGDFSWAGRVYQYRVARTLPCLSPSS